MKPIIKKKLLNIITGIKDVVNDLKHAQHNQQDHAGGRGSGGSGGGAPKKMTAMEMSNHSSGGGSLSKDEVRSVLKGSKIEAKFVKENKNRKSTEIKPKDRSLIRKDVISEMKAAGWNHVGERKISGKAGGMEDAFEKKGFRARTNSRKFKSTGVDFEALEITKSQ